MKRFLIALIALTLVLGVFAGCGGNSGTAEAPAPEAAEDAVEEEAPADDAGDAAEEENVPAELSDTLIVGLDDQFPPMGYRNENNELVGFDIDLALEVGSRLGMEVVLQPINWSTKEMELDGGKVDLLWNGLTITDARKEAMLITNPYLKNAQVIVVQADSEITAKADLEGKIVALQNGSSADDAFSKPENGIVDIVSEKVGYDDNVMALTDLGHGRVDALVVDRVVADYYLALNPGTYKILDDELEAEEFGIAFKRPEEEDGVNPLYEAVVGALSEMIEDGTAEAISVQWFGENRIIFEP